MAKKVNDNSMKWLSDNNVSWLAKTINDAETEDLTLRIQPTGQFRLSRLKSTHRPFYDIPTKQMISGMLMNYCDLNISNKFRNLLRTNKTTAKDICGLLGVPIKGYTSDFIPLVYNQFTITGIHVPELNKHIDYVTMIQRDEKGVWQHSPRYVEYATCDTPYYLRIKATKAFADLIREHEHISDDVFFGENNDSCSLTIANDVDIEFMEYVDVYTDKEYASTFRNAIKNFNQFNVWDRYGLALMLMYYCDTKGISRWEDVSDDILDTRIDKPLVKMLLDKYIKPYMFMLGHIDEANNTTSFTWATFDDLSKDNILIAPYISTAFTQSAQSKEYVKNLFSIFEFMDKLEGEGDVKICGKVTQKMTPFSAKSRQLHFNGDGDDFTIYNYACSQKDNSVVFGIFTSMTKDKLYTSYKDKNYSALGYIPDLQKFEDAFRYVRYMKNYSDSILSTNDFTYKFAMKAMTQTSLLYQSKDTSAIWSNVNHLLKKTRTDNEVFTSFNHRYIDSIVNYYQLHEMVDIISDKMLFVKKFYAVGPDDFYSIDGSISEEDKLLMDNKLPQIMWETAKKVRIDNTSILFEGKANKHNKTSIVENYIIKMINAKSLDVFNDYILTLSSYVSKPVNIPSYNNIINYIMASTNIDKDVCELAHKMANDIKGASYKACLNTFFGVSHSSKIIDKDSEAYVSKKKDMEYRLYNHTKTITDTITPVSVDSPLSFLNALMTKMYRLTSHKFRFVDENLNKCLLLSSEEFTVFKQLFILYLNSTSYNNSTSENNEDETETVSESEEICAEI